MCKCYVCENDASGQCKQCGQFYCVRHGGGPLKRRGPGIWTTGESSIGYCKYCLIGWPERVGVGPSRSDEACELVQEIARAFSHDQLMWRYREQLKGESVSLFPDSPASKIAKWVQDMQERVGRDVLSAEQAERLLRMLLERLLYDKNWLSRYHVAEALRLLSDYHHGIWVWEDWGGFWIVEDAVQALMWTLKHDESFWVRGAAARSLVQMQYRGVVEPLTELYRGAVADRLAKMQSGEVAELPPGFVEITADQHLEPALRDLLEAYEFRWTLQGFTKEDAELVRRCLQDAQSGFEDTKSDD